MSQVYFLDSGPLGLLTHPNRHGEVIAITDWVSRALLGGNRIVVPAIVYYELRRELLRAEKLLGLGRLDAFVNAAANRYLPLSDSALKLAAELWARSRREGHLTASPAALDIDVVLAAQALSFSGEVTIVTTNRKHLENFADAKHWDEVGLPS